jgi:hypothetical protein
MVMPMLDDELRSTLGGYGQRYGWPTTVAQRRGLVATLLRLTRQSTGIPLAPSARTLIIDQVMADWEAGRLATAIANPTQEAVIDQAHQWQESLTQNLTDTVTAYLQGDGSALEPTDLQGILLTAMPLLAGDRITQAEVNGLLDQMVKTFDWEAALVAPINPTVASVVQSLAIALGQKPLATVVSETVTAYVQQFAPTLVTIGEDLIEQALRAVLNNALDFNFDTDLQLVDQQLLITQVSFSLNLMEQSPAPTKTARHIAAEWGEEIGRFKAQRQGDDGTVDVTTGLGSQDGLSISSGWTSTRSPLPPES